MEKFFLQLGKNTNFHVILAQGPTGLPSDGLHYLCGSRPRLTMLCDRLDLCRVSKCRSRDFRFEASLTQSNDSSRHPVRYRPAQRPNLEIDIFESPINVQVSVLSHFLEYTQIIFYCVNKNGFNFSLLFVLAMNFQRSHKVQFTHSSLLWHFFNLIGNFKFLFQFCTFLFKKSTFFTSQ